MYSIVVLRCKQQIATAYAASSVLLLLLLWCLLRMACPPSLPHPLSPPHICAIVLVTRMRYGVDK